MKLDINTKKLYEAVLSLKSENECQKFFRDLLTEPEIKEFANRWKAAQMLDKKIKYDVIEKETGMSSTTIARISKWLNSGSGGYKFMLKRIKNKSKKNHHCTRLVAV
ncbi:MAG TPA: YerC/YecD family TrpR-related protein [Candidatus Limnocylindrales bacterium]|nr:YerC/YecD family TrpR-related protein [Candidatus Limnocylindrales bacterium]